MNGGKKRTHSPSWRALMDLVPDAKYGSGDTDEEISEERWEELKGRLTEGPDLSGFFYGDLESPVGEHGTRMASIGRVWR